MSYVYLLYHSKYGIRCNDPDGVLMSFPKLTPKEILKVLKVVNNRITREMNRQIILDDIYKADADKVLDFIIKVRSGTEKSFHERWTVI